MENKIKVSAVSYLNTKPLLYGIEHHPVLDQIVLDIEYPSLIARDLIENKTDVGLVPVAAMPMIQNARIISDYGIASDGNVASVCIFSRQPVEKIERLYLDYQSRTSVRLAQVLLEKYWEKDVEYLKAPENYMDLITGNTAGVIIGDRALQSLGKYEYVYDLATCWKDYTGLDFIFAAWVANKELPESFIKDFNEANRSGLDNIDTVIAETPCQYYDLNVYYKQNIRFVLDDAKRKGLERFLSEIKQ